MNKHTLNVIMMGLSFGLAVSSFAAGFILGGLFFLVCAIVCFVVGVNED